MSEHFRRIIKREPPPHQAIKFRCAKLHRVTDGHESSSHYNTIYDVLKSRGWKEWGATTNTSTEESFSSGGGVPAPAAGVAAGGIQRGTAPHGAPESSFSRADAGRATSTAGGARVAVGLVGSSSSSGAEAAATAPSGVAIAASSSSAASTGPVLSTTAATTTASSTTHQHQQQVQVPNKKELKQDWHIFWADKDWIHSELEKLHLEPHQRVNHFRNHYELTRKDLLAKNVKRYRRALEREGTAASLELAKKYEEMIPSTFVLPQEYSLFLEEFKRCGKQVLRRRTDHVVRVTVRDQVAGDQLVWIMKPVGRSQGTGIFMVTKLSQLAQWKPPERQARDDADEDDVESYIVQKYIEHPLLIGGRKFDLRIYALVTSYQPLTVWLSREGFARFSLTRYSVDTVRDPTKLSSHLTNVAVQKNLFSKDNTYQRTGGKWEIPSMKKYLISKIGRERTKKLFLQFEEIIIYSLLAVQRVMIADRHCFEMYGYDIMIDANFNPTLIEVNASPSLTANTKADYEMKFATLDDVMTILDLEKYLNLDEVNGNDVEPGGRGGAGGGPSTTHLEHSRDTTGAAGGTKEHGGARSELQSTNITRVGGFDLIYKGGPVEGHVESMLGARNDRDEQLKQLAEEIWLRTLC